jgi:hypothetical protein
MEFQTYLFWRWDIYDVITWIRILMPPLIVLLIIWRRPGLVMAVVAVMTVSIVLRHWERPYLIGIFYYDFARHDLPMLGYLTFPLAWWFAYRHLRRKLVRTGEDDAG